MKKPTVYFAVDKDGMECEYYGKPPIRDNRYAHWYPNPLGEEYKYLIEGTIKEITGKDLTWEDGPFEWNG